jgi:hypothetical protein
MYRSSSVLAVPLPSHAPPFTAVVMHAYDVVMHPDAPVLPEVRHITG